jgi:hypothetical protein
MVMELRPEAPVILMTAFEMNKPEFSKVMPHTPDGFIAQTNLVEKVERIYQRNYV